MMLIVPRHVREIAETDDSRVENPALPLSGFREKGAWVLLGEPGAGKSAALKEEARETGGLYISIAEFLSDAPDSDWRGKILFLDGLDETRAGGDEVSVLFKLRSHLKKLGNPQFRIACRAADWFGSTDRQTIGGASPDGQLAVLVLEPLSEKQILEILYKNHGISNPQGFIEQAADHRLDGLLSNPQTLQLLAKAIRDGQWPQTLQETYQLACRQLAGEDNRAHRTRQQAQPISVDQVLETAGQLCAVLLLADKQGLALDPESADQHFPCIDDFCPPDPATAHRAAKRKLFRPIANREERVVPSHRGIAEYLAAQWLAVQIQGRGLPFRRVLQLLQGHDDRTVAGLRGLYGWLALHCQAARRRLIEADPLTVIVYGDVKPMPPEDKRKLLEALRREAMQHLAFRWQLPSVKTFGALADRELAGDFAAALESPERDKASQSFTDCVLDIFVEGEPIPELAGTIKSVILDESRHDRVRINALLAWLKQQPPAEDAHALLDAINEGRVADPDDELAGLLLGHLYPKIIKPEILLGYFHAPKDQDLIGSYSWFWGYELPKMAPDSHLPMLLDQLAARTDPSFSDEVDFNLDYRRLSGILLTRGIKHHGVIIDDSRLFAWLGICIDKHGEIRLDNEHLEIISRWLANHPSRYKAILALCYKRCESAEDVRYCIYTCERRLHNAGVPEDLGIWHLEQASQMADDTLAEHHLTEAINSLFWQRGNSGLFLETLDAWRETHPERQHLLVPLLKCEITDRQREHTARAKARKQEQAVSKRTRSIAVSKYLPAIRSGTAPSGQLYELSGVWMNLYSDIYGETPKERFDSYCENGAEVLAAAEAGFFLCPERKDLPSVTEIIDLNIRKRQHFICRPCLIGMDLRWQKDPSNIEVLENDTLRRMIAFKLTYDSNKPEWFSFIINERPELLAEVLIDYASTTFKAGKDHVNGIAPLALSPDYLEVAKIAVPHLLELFPVRANSSQLPQLSYLLKAALRHTAKQLPGILDRKLKAKGMDVAQRVYWLTAAMLLDPARESDLLRYIGKSWTRANHLCALLGERFVDLTSEYPLSARISGKLIELLTPHAELDRQRSGVVNDAMRRGEAVHGLVTYLGTMATDDAAQEIERLSALPTLGKLKYSLEHTCQQLKLRQREAAFSFLSISDVARILANREPTSSLDLAALAVDHLDDLARKIRQDNSDLFRFFWTETEPNSPKPENSCRDVLLDQLKSRIEPFGIDCLPEADHFNDKRADIRLSYRNAYELPIEIKRESNKSLWTGLRSQLIGKYAIAPKAAGHGIYLVLWFGRKGIPAVTKGMPAVTDGGKTPTSPADLQRRLEAQLNPEERRRIFVRVLDVSWPAK